MRINLKELQDEVEAEGRAKAKTERCSRQRSANAPAWSESKAEELIATLYLCAGMLAWSNDLIFTGWVCVAKFFLGITFSVIKALSAAAQPNGKDQS